MKHKKKDRDTDRPGINVRPYSKINKAKRAGRGVVQVVEHLLKNPKTLNSNPSKATTNPPQKRKVKEQHVLL
jgi:hypothetical protein